MSLSTGLRFRIYVDDELVDEEWIGRPGDRADPELLARWQGTICRDASIKGKSWRLEVYEPDSDSSMWFGSISMGMVMPTSLLDVKDPSPN